VNVVSISKTRERLETANARRKHMKLKDYENSFLSIDGKIIIKRTWQK